MDETLLRRMQAISAVLIGIAYFLPWASIISPLGSIRVAWALCGLRLDTANTCHSAPGAAIRKIEQRCPRTAWFVAEVYGSNRASGPLCVRCLLCLVRRKFWFQRSQRFVGNTA